MSGRINKWVSKTYFGYLKAYFIINWGNLTKDDI